MTTTIIVITASFLVFFFLFMEFLKFLLKKYFQEIGLWNEWKKTVLNFPVPNNLVEIEPLKLPQGLRFLGQNTLRTMKCYITLCNGGVLFSYFLPSVFMRNRKFFVRWCDFGSSRKVKMLFKEFYEIDIEGTELKLVVNPKYWDDYFSWHVKWPSVPQEDEKN